MVMIVGNDEVKPFETVDASIRWYTIQ